MPARIGNIRLFQLAPPRLLCLLMLKSATTMPTRITKIPATFKTDNVSLRSITAKSVLYRGYAAYMLELTDAPSFLSLGNTGVL